MIIGIIGRTGDADGVWRGSAGAGKDTAADYLVRSQGFVKISIADEMKRVVCRVFGFPETAVWGNDADKEKPYPEFGGLTIRKALQLLGTEWGRTCYQNIWIDKAIRDAYTVLLNGYEYSRYDGVYEGVAPIMWSGVVIPDVRYMNEVLAIRDNSTKNKIVRISRVLPKKNEWSTHISETSLLDIPGVYMSADIISDGSIKELEAKIASCLRGFYAIPDSTLP